MAIGSRARIWTMKRRTASTCSGVQRELRVRLRADHPIGVEPDVVHAHGDQPAQPGLGHQVDVGLADARRDADEQPVAAAGFEAGERLGQHVHPAAALVADDLACLRC